ncbi:MAG: hypothetical protein ACR2J5_14860 [Geodermatophilaceae bacterium]
MLTRLIRGISFLAVTAVALFQYATWHHLSPDFGPRVRLGVSSYIELMQGLFDSIGTGTRIAIFVALFSTLTSTALLLRRSRSAAFVTGAAAVLVAATAVVATTYNASVNARIMAWSMQDPRADLDSVRAQWEWGHGLTAGFVVLSMLLLVAALQLSPIVSSKATSSPGS